MNFCKYPIARLDAPKIGGAWGALWKARWWLASPQKRREQFLKMCSSRRFWEGEDTALKSLAQLRAWVDMGLIDDERHSTQLMSVLHPDSELAQDVFNETAFNIIERNTPSEALHLLIEAGFDCKNDASYKNPDMRGDNLITHAASLGRVDHLKVLVQTDADINWVSSYQEHAVWLAIRHACIAPGEKENGLGVLRILLEHGANPDAKVRCQQQSVPSSPLGMAAGLLWREGVDVLLEHQADAGMSNESGNVLHHMVNALRKTTDMDRTTIAKACRMIEVLVEAGADINDAAYEDTGSPLEQAVKNGNFTMFAALIEKCANIETTRLASDVLLGQRIFNAFSWCEPDGYQFILNLPMSIWNEKDEKGRTPIDIFNEVPEREMSRRGIKMKLDIEAKLLSDQTPRVSETAALSKPRIRL